MCGGVWGKSEVAGMWREEDVGVGEGGEMGSALIKGELCRQQGPMSST